MAAHSIRGCQYNCPRHRQWKRQERCWYFSHGTRVVWFRSSGRRHCRLAGHDPQYQAATTIDGWGLIIYQVPERWLDQAHTYIHGYEQISAWLVDFLMCLWYSTNNMRIGLDLELDFSSTILAMMTLSWLSVCRYGFFCTSSGIGVMVFHLCINNLIFPVCFCFCFLFYSVLCMGYALLTFWYYMAGLLWIERMDKWTTPSDLDSSTRHVRTACVVHDCYR